MLQVHKHLRPIEAADDDDAVNECRPIAKTFDVFLFKEALQLIAICLVLGTFLANPFGAGADLAGRFPNRIDVPSQGDKNNRSNEGSKTGACKEAPVRFQRFGSQIEPSLHSLLLLNPTKSSLVSVHHP